MNEFFPFKEFLKIGIFTKEMKGNYELQAQKICDFLGIESVYEYGHISFNCHIEPSKEFVTKIESIYVS